MSVNLGTAYAELKLKTTGFNQGITEAKGQLDSFKNKADLVATGFTAVGKTMTNVGSTLTKSVTVPLVGLGTAAVKTTATFDASMSKVQALSGATGKDFEKLRNTAIEMGSKTAFSASEAADALSYMGLAGWKTDQMIAGLPGILDLAAASQMDLAEASDMVTDYLTAFGLEASDATKMANQMSYAQANSNTTTRQLGDAFGNCAAQMNTAGQSMETTTAFLEAMANQGLKGSEAGTALSATVRDITQKMSKLASTEELAGAAANGLTSVTGDMNDLLGVNAIQIGNVLIPVEDLNGNFRSMIDIMGDVEKATEGMGSAQKSAALLDTFTARSIKAVSMSLTEGVDNIRSYEAALHDVDGVASEMADQMLNNLNGQLTLLKSALETLAIQIGDILMPHIKEIVKKVQELVTAFTELDTAQKEQILKWAAIVAAIGPALLAIGKLTTGIGGLISTGVKITSWLSSLSSAFGLAGGAAGSLSGALAGIASALGPILVVIAAIVALGVALKAAYDQGGEFTKAVNEMADVLKKDLLAAFEEAKRIFEIFKETLKNVWKTIKKNFDFSAVDKSLAGLTKAFTKLYETLRPILTILIKIFEGVVATTVVPMLSWIAGLITGIVKALAPLIDTITDIVNIVKDSVDIIVGLLRGLVTGDFSQFLSGMKNIHEDIISLVKNLIKTILTFYEGFIEGFLAALDGFTGGLVTKIGEVISNIVDSIMNFFTVTIPNAFNNLVTTTTEFLSNVWESFKNFFTVQIPEAINNFIHVTLPNFINTAREFFDQLPYYLGYAVGLALGKLKQWGEDMKQWVSTEVPIIINNIIKFFQELPGKIWTWLQNVLAKVNQWGAQMKQKAIEIANAFVTNVINYIKELPGKIWTWLQNTINKIIEWGNQMKAKAAEIANAFVDNVVTPIKELPEKLAEIIKQIPEKLKDLVGAMKEAGASLMNGLFDGLKSVWEGIEKWFNGIVEKVKKFIEGIKKGMEDAKNSSKDANTSSSNADGLAYVPFNGYKATLHEGERVLTKNQASAYNQGQTLAAGNTFIFQSPKALDPYESTRLFKQTIHRLEEGFA